MPLNDKHEKGIKLIEKIKNTEEIAGAAMCCNSKKIAERWGDERGELLFGEEFCAESVLQSREGFEGIPNNEGLYSSKPFCRLERNSITWSGLPRLERSTLLNVKK